MREEFVVSDENLQKLCAEWRDRLRLNSWDIAAGVYRASDFVNENCIGENTFDLETGRSVIKVLDSIDYPKDSWFPQDMEVILVHELLHLHFDPFCPEENTLQHQFMERTIERLAITLVDLKRERTEREENETCLNCVKTKCN
jgi:hypothetical protein